MNSLNSEYRNQRGNVLFLILIAVALFAALSYAVSQSTRSGSGDVSREDVQLCLAELDNHFLNMRTSIQRIKALGYDDHQIDVFSNQFRQRSGTVIGSPNGSCPDAGCRLFNDNGGLAIPYRLSSKCLDPSDTYFAGAAEAGHYFFMSYRIPQIGDQTRNSIYAEVIRVSDAVCRAYNIREGFADIGPLVNSSWFGNRTSTSSEYRGTLSAVPPDNGVDFATLINPIVSTNGRSSFCYTLDTALGTRGILSLMLQR